MRIIGSLSSSSGSRAALEATTYTEQTTNAIRSLVSSSANDTAAGTGARTVRLIYWSWDGTTMLGPFSEIVTLNGATDVPTVGSFCFLESMEVLTAGSGGTNAGTISINTTAGGSTAFGSIAVGANKTNWGHHYVGSKYHSRLQDLLLTSGAVAGGFEVDVLQLPGGVEKSLTGPALIQVATTLSQQVVFNKDDARVIGPARIRMYVTPASGTATVSQAVLGLVDDKVTF